VLGTVKFSRKKINEVLSDHLMFLEVEVAIKTCCSDFNFYRADSYNFAVIYSLIPVTVTVYTYTLYRSVSEF
jgi:hypothetical protein